jgi:hypothetical protein
MCCCVICVQCSVEVTMCVGFVCAGWICCKLNKGSLSAVLVD